MSSPVHVSAAAMGNGPVKVTQVYVDGKKAFESSGNALETDLKLNAGTHTVTVQGLDNDGFFKQKNTVTVR